MNDKPPVSVIINTFNGAECVSGAVNSVLGQDYPDVEIIVVDDNGLGSEKQQATRAALADYIDSGRITYLPNEQNIGDPASKNAGLAISRGEYIAFLDDDDEYPDPTKLTKCVETLAALDDSWGAVYTAIEVRWPGLTMHFNTRQMPSGDILYDLLIHSIYINPSNVVVKRKAILDVGGYDTAYKRHVDWGYHAMLASKYKFAYLPIIGGIHNNQNPRFVAYTDANKRMEQLGFYVKRTSRFTEHLPHETRLVIACVNVMLMNQLKNAPYSKCRSLMAGWGFTLTPRAYLRAMVVFLKIKYDRYYKA
ncbi:MAG: glycosyltransferase family 2 protein [Abditibacteriota bacterium]|nr:glycosyltransferase family 2 protein [Abditibacteriota bacterium]